jgi:hypothetical protein
MPAQSPERRAARRVVATAVAILGCSALSMTGTAAAQPAAAGGVPQPFSASYEVFWKGVNAASAGLELRRDGTDRYTYVSRNNARGMFRLAFPGEVNQTSQFTLEAGRPRPVSYRADDGTDDTRRDVSLTFDWAAMRVRGRAEDKPVDVALRPGAQDGMSVQIALMLDLQRGGSPDGFWLIDRNELKQYEYTGEGVARIATALGELDTVIWSSRRPGSERVTRVWYAPSLGYLPVQAERRRGGKLEWQMRITRLSRPAGS